MSDTADRYRCLRSLYKQAEDAIHNLGIEGSGTDILAINELRYAGHHLLNALTSEKENDKEEQFSRFTRHCERALYEAYDCSIYYHLVQFQKFKIDFAKVTISDVIPDFLEVEMTMRKCKKFLEQARSGSEKREDYYKEAKSTFSKVAEANLKCQAAREELAKKLWAMSRESRRWWRGPIAILVSALIGALVTILVVY